MNKYSPGCKHWHASVNFKNAVDEFAEKYAATPDITLAKYYNEEIINEIQNHFKSQSIYITPEFVGSAFEGLKVKGSLWQRGDIEFDVMFVFELGHTATIEKTDLANYVLIHNSLQTPKFNDHNGYLLPSLVTNDFFGKIQSCVNKMHFLELNGLKIILRKHGPAIQIDIQSLERIDSNPLLIYSVDIVPAVKFNENEYYVPKELKPNDPQKIDQHLRPLLWRRSYSLDEKEKIQSIDVRDGDPRKVLRILKTIRNHDPTLMCLSSYHLKNIFLKVCESATYSELWCKQFMGERLVDLLWQLASCLENRNLPCYFHRDINLLEGINDVTLSNLKNRCIRMMNSEPLMKELLKASY